MKKLAVAQIVLGILISLATAFIIAWDFPDAFYIHVGSYENGTFQTIFNPDLKEVIAACLTIMLLLLGLTVLGFGIAQFIEGAEGQNSEGFLSLRKSKNGKLSIIQVALGWVITVAAVLVMVWGFPTSYFYELPNDKMGGLFFMPGREMVMAMQLSVLVFLLGLLVIGCGIAQFIKTNRLKGTKSLKEISSLSSHQREHEEGQREVQPLL